MPRIGGVAVFLGFLAGLLYAAHVTGKLYSTGTVTVYWRAMGLATVAMFLMGLVDDLRGLSFKSKFAVQIAAAVAVWYAGFRIDAVSLPLLPDSTQLAWLSLPITVFWIVGITNAINLIDGLDGLAAGTALIMTSAVAAIAMVQQQEGVVAASVALVGALIGFLVFNFNPAKIFLGDSGSMFLGFVLAVISIRGAQKGTTAVAVLAPLLILALPIFDTSAAVLRRFAQLAVEDPGERRRMVHVLGNVNRLFLPDRGHIHHRLLDLGLSHRTAVLVLYGVVTLLAAAALADVALHSRLVAVLLLCTLFAVIASFVLVALRRRKRAAARQAVGDHRGADLSPGRGR